MENPVQKVLALNGYRYDFKLSADDVGKGHRPEGAYGVLAREVERVLPRAVRKNAAGEYFVSYSELIPVLIEEEQQRQTRAVERENEELRELFLQSQERAEGPVQR